MPPNIFWAAYQNDGGAWTRLPDGHGCNTIDVASRLTVATVTGNSPPRTEITYLTAAEAASYFSCNPVTTPLKHVHLRTLGLHGTDYSVVSFGRSHVVNEGISLFRFDQVQTGALDLVASRVHGLLDTIRVTSVVVRRAQIIADGDTAVVDYDGAEAFAPDSIPVSITGVPPGADASLTSQLLTATGGLNPLGFSPATNDAANAWVLPPSERVSSDLHLLSVETTGSTLLSVRAYLGTVPPNPVLALGPAPNPPVFSTIETSPIVRLRVDVESQAAYGEWITMYLVGVNSSVLLGMTKGYAGGTPGTWSMPIPELDGIAGFDHAWGLGTETPQSIEVVSGFPFLFPGNDAIRDKSFASAVLFSPGLSGVQAQALLRAGR
jgi:hypothetical protein